MIKAAFYPARGCCLPSALNIWVPSHPAHLRGCLHTRTHREDGLHSSSLKHPQEQWQSNTVLCLHGKHQESSGTEDVMLAGNREKSANPQQASLEQQRKGKAGSALLRSPLQRPPQLPGGGAALLISGLFLAHSPCISSPAGPQEQLAGF